MAKRKEDVFSVPSPTPNKLAKLIDAYRASKALFAACELGNFDKLHSSISPQSAREISESISSDLDATTRLMDALVGLEFLEKTKHGDQWVYNNSQMSTKFLTSSSPESKLGIIALENKMGYPLFGNLESAVREGATQWWKTFGKSPDDIWQEEYSSEEAILRFMSAMHSTALYGSYAVAQAIDLSEYSSCCDLGG